MDFLKNERGLLTLILVYASGVGLFSLALPVATQSLVNSVAFGAVLQPIVVLTFAVVVFTSLSGVMKVFQTLCTEYLQRRIFVHYSTRIARHLPSILIRSKGTENAHETVNRFFDIFLVQKAVSSLLLDGVAIVLQAVVGLLVLAFYHPLLLAFDCILVFLIWVIVFPMGRGALVSAVNESSAKYAMAAWLEELARLPLLFRSSRSFAHVEATADSKILEWLSARSEHFRRLFAQTLGTLVLQVFASATLLGFGGWLVIRNQLTLGQLVAAELIVAGVVGGLTKFGKQFESFYDAVAGFYKLDQILELPTERASGRPFVLSNGQARGLSLRLKDVVCELPDDGGVLGPIQMDIPAGSRVLIFGPPGSGKSDLANLLGGYKAPEKGVVELDGSDLREIGLPSVRDSVMLLRNVELIDDTIENNLRASKPDASLKEIQEALEDVGLLDVVHRLKLGLQTRLRFWGAPLSGPQARRLMLARAFLTRPKLLILDKSVDAVTLVENPLLLQKLCHDQRSWTLVLFADFDLTQAVSAPIFDAVFSVREGKLVHQSPQSSGEGA